MSRFALSLAFLIAQCGLGLAVPDPQPECNATDVTLRPGKWGDCGVKLGSVPSQVTIITRGLPGDGSCSGSLIDPRHVLTSASCLLGSKRQDNETEMEGYVFAGSQDMGEMFGHILEGRPLAKDTRKAKVDNVRAHPSAGIQPICLQQAKSPPEGQAVAVGWGFSSVHESTTLRLTHLNVSEDCTFSKEAEEKFVCESSFEFDEMTPFAFRFSGGPVIAQVNGSYVQVGVVSTIHNLTISPDASALSNEYSLVNQASDFISSLAKPCWVK